jgi:hypothetical protein
MTFQSSGPISLGDVNVELGNSNNLPINLGEVNVRGLLGKLSGAISLSDAYGKSFVNVNDYYSYSSPFGPKKNSSTFTVDNTHIQLIPEVEIVPFVWTPIN